MSDIHVFVSAYIPDDEMVLSPKRYEWLVNIFNYYNFEETLSVTVSDFPRYTPRHSVCVDCKNAHNLRGNLKCCVFKDIVDSDFYCKKWEKR